MIISRTPFRISFFGGGTDYPAWFQKHGGAVLATSIDKYCYISCRHLPPFFEYKHKISYSKIEYTQSITDIKHPAIKTTLEFMKIKKGLEINYQADLPARAARGDVPLHDRADSGARPRRADLVLRRDPRDLGGVHPREVGPGAGALRLHVWAKLSAGPPAAAHAVRSPMPLSRVQSWPLRDAYPGRASAAALRRSA